MAAEFNEVDSLAEMFFFLDGPTGLHEGQQAQLTSENISSELPHYSGFRPNSSSLSSSSLRSPHHPAITPTPARNTTDQNASGPRLNGSVPAPGPTLVSNRALHFHPVLLKFMQNPPIQVRSASMSLAYIQLAFVFNSCQHDPNHEWTHGRPSPELYQAALVRWNSLDLFERYALAKQAAIYVARIPNAAWYPPPDFVLVFQPIM